MSELKQTALYSHHLDLKAKMAEFAGYSMPIQYESVKKEVEAVRQSAGVFDVSHMGEFFVTGKDAASFTDYIMTNDYLNSPIGKAVYSPMCREDGTVIDDLIAYKLEEEETLICVNASNIEKDWNWLSQQAQNFDVKLIDRSKDFSLLALQGPQSAAILSKLGLDGALAELDYYAVKEIQSDGSRTIIARTGYTGEDGFEIFCSHEFAAQIWQHLLKENVTPCGLAARDVLRLEVCFPLYGHEIHDQVTPLDSSLKWTVKFSKNKFIGKQALECASPQFQLVKLIVEKGIPRDGYTVHCNEGQEIGVITSGTHSVSLGKGIALAHIKRELLPKGDQLQVKIRNRMTPAQKVKKAFIQGGHK